MTDLISLDVAELIVILHSLTRPMSWPALMMLHKCIHVIISCASITPSTIFQNLIGASDRCSSSLAPKLPVILREHSMMGMLWQMMERYWLNGRHFVGGDKISIADLLMVTELDMLHVLDGASQVGLLGCLHGPDTIARVSAGPGS